MPRLFIANARVLAVVMIGVLAISIVCVNELAIRAAEPPAKATPPDRLPAQAVAPAEQKIRDALEGKSHQATGDGVLDDVLGLIKQRRSILKGSSLDPANSDREATSGPHAESEVAWVAEQMLKAARLLESIGAPDQGRSDLVQRMRDEAGKLLSE